MEHFGDLINSIEITPQVKFRLKNIWRELQEKNESSQYLHDFSALDIPVVARLSLKATFHANEHDDNNYFFMQIINNSGGTWDYLLENDYENLIKAIERQASNCTKSSYAVANRLFHPTSDSGNCWEKKKISILKKLNNQIFDNSSIQGNISAMYEKEIIRLQREDIDAYFEFLKDKFHSIGMKILLSQQFLDVLQDFDHFYRKGNPCGPRLPNSEEKMEDRLIVMSKYLNTAVSQSFLNPHLEACYNKNPMLAINTLKIAQKLLFDSKELTTNDDIRKLRNHISGKMNKIKEMYKDYCIKEINQCIALLT